MRINHLKNMPTYKQTKYFNLWILKNEDVSFSKFLESLNLNENTFISTLIAN